ncbi:MAG: metalloregulator ArsR/SmtB family transcription factor [TACK group archaeon]|nr:metalloregulator ArsR/SmtB family transcription factor [TACK group archaeon]
MSNPSCDALPELLDVKSYEEKEALLRTLSNKTRLALLDAMIKHGEICACEVEPVLKLAQPTVTLHLQKLYAAGLLRRREDSKFTYYSIREEYVPLVKTVLSLKKPSRSRRKL